MARGKGDELGCFLALWTRIGAGILGAKFFLFFIVSGIGEIARNFFVGWLLAYALLFTAYRLWGKAATSLGGGRLTLLALLAAGGRLPAAVFAGLAAWYVGGLVGVYGAVGGAAFFYLLFFSFAGWWFRAGGRALRPPPSERGD
ncbi:hypothetical protein C7438_1506 [Brockia lithotrophica]|uniref:Uncharacterized protein n=1 Tax=Brockia lithotrophica TaxID=933949 RepID=A0A660KTG0_9BACL|nr:hypothetical protein C7438_1506 [Brockia lithotrophica]